MCRHRPAYFCFSFGALFLKGAQTLTKKKNPNKFNYDYNGKNIELPRFDKLPFGTMRKMRHADEADQAFILLESTADEKSLAVLDTMGVDEIGELLDAWQKAAEVTTGESAD